MMITRECDHVPLMFQAQIEGRCQIQFIKDEPRQQAEDWVDEWLKGTVKKTPQFGADVETKPYKIPWRWVSNSGQDEDIIRPLIAAKGYPYYPGSSMKGTFRRACTPEEAQHYCGGKEGKKTRPGILRFHGGYPKNETWKKTPLVDLIHPQEDWQIKNSNSHRALIQISMLGTTLVFGISSSKKLCSDEWEKIWRIWHRAIEKGIGLRTSAGYGQPQHHGKSPLLRVKLKGQGLASRLIYKSGDFADQEEFRPNLFKGALRGHTQRLFAGVTDEATTQALTQELWGGIADQKKSIGSDQKKSIVGLLGTAFSYQFDKLILDQYPYKDSKLPLFELTAGNLDLLGMRSLPDEETTRELKKLITQLIKFSMLLGGFGKSWRRVDHRLVFPKYVNNCANNIHVNPMIGCHWEFSEGSEKYYVSVGELTDITIFLEKLRTNLQTWVRSKKKQVSNPNTFVSWRETWHPDNVQVWGRIANNKFDSKAVGWFHSNYSGVQRIKKTLLTGQLNQIGRIWHRMYPRYIKVSENTLQPTREYIELLTIFPNIPDEDERQKEGERQKAEDFLTFLDTKTSFSLLYPG